MHPRNSYNGQQSQSDVPSDNQYPAHYQQQPQGDYPHHIQGQAYQQVPYVQASAAPGSYHGSSTGQATPYTQANPGYYQQHGTYHNSAAFPPSTPHPSLGNYTPQTGHHNTHHQFVPTPAQTMQSFPNNDGYAHGGTHPPAHSALYPVQSHPGSGHMSQGGYVASTAPPNAGPAASTGERFLCEHCSASFSRAHDRRRHFETHHMPQRTIHRCPACEREFARADSLKRHVDGGCSAR